METIRIKEKILASREERFQKIQFLEKDFKTVITVKTNIPGDNKSINLAYTIVKLFKNLIPNSFIDKILFFDSYDGPYYIIGSNSDANAIKFILIELEDTHALGRFIDLDVFDGEKTLVRTKPRKCYLCNDTAFNCIRQKKHSINELIKYVEEKTIDYFKVEIFDIIDDCILLELNLHPKFGLVTPNTRGSHKDMSYKIMTKAKDAIVPYLVEMFHVGWTSKLEEIFIEIRTIGLDAENEMFMKTNNINSYKGLIFNLGILVAAYGYLFSNHHDLENIFDIVKSISRNILDDFNTPNNTFGYRAYKEYNILGARGEVYKGIPNVEKALKYLKDFSKESRLRTLMYLISEVDDTVLLKRCNDINYYQEVRSMFKDCLTHDETGIIELDKYCISNNLSFGGSADLLILTIFLKRIGL